MSKPVSSRLAYLVSFATAALVSGLNSTAQQPTALQTRLLQFVTKAAEGPRSLQGFSVAVWEPLGVAPVGRAGGPPPPLPPRALKVVTTNLLEGWLRRNGVAYSEQTTLTEHWDRVAFPNGDVWLTVSQYVSDPRYLTGEYTTSMHFKREPDGSRWKPAPCRPI